MTIAYAIGLAFGALFSAYVVSRGLLWVTRRWHRGVWRSFVANGASFAMIIGISVVVRAGFEWPAAALHLIAQLIWLYYDLYSVSRTDS